MAQSLLALSLVITCSLPHALSLFPSCSLALSLAAGLALNHGALAADLPLESITLYRSGVGYFEHSGSVNGHETVTLRFEADRVNDILKSMVAIDFGGGRIAGAALRYEQSKSKEYPYLKDNL